MKATKMAARIAGLVLAGMMVIGLVSCGGNPVKGKTFSDGSLTIEFKDGKNVVFDGMPERPWDKNPVLKTTYKITGKGYKKQKQKSILIPNLTQPVLAMKNLSMMKKKILLSNKLPASF